MGDTFADAAFLSNRDLSKNIYEMMPFIASMIILAFTSKNSQAPKAEGIKYDKGTKIFNLGDYL